jgi:hypothetical protein
MKYVMMTVSSLTNTITQMFFQRKKIVAANHIAG